MITRHECGARRRPWAAACALALLGCATAWDDQRQDGGGRDSPGVLLQPGIGGRPGVVAASQDPVPCQCNPGCAAFGGAGSTEPSGAAGAAGQSPELTTGDQPTVALVVFDKSGSMSGSWGPGNKWEAAGQALLGAIEPAQQRLTVGAILFPMGGDVCDVAPLDDPWQLGFRSGPEFLRDWTVLAPCSGPDGNTPLELAFRVADSAIQVARDGGLLERRFIVLLLTDGEPNCNSDLGVVTGLAAKWFDQGIATYVFGLPGSENASAVLDAIASAGGTDVYVAPGTPGELEQGMAAAM